MKNKNFFSSFCASVSENKNCSTVFCVIFLIYVLFNFSLSATLFFMRFPESYTWTELFINYEGGFIRRGLIGEIVYILSNYIDTRIAVFFLFLFMYCLFVFFSIKLLNRGLDCFSLLFVIISPGLLFFFTQDRDMFCRKDIFFETGFILQFFILTLKDKKTLSLFIYITLIYIFCLLVHESTIFYSILPFSILLKKAHDENKFYHYLILLCILYVASAWYICSFSGDNIQKESIILSWSKFFNIEHELALKYIGKSLLFQFNQVKSYFSITILYYYLFALILTSFPAIYIIKKYNVVSLVYKYFNFRLGKICVFWGFIAPWTISILAIDYGRHIHSATLNIIAFATTLLILTNKQKQNLSPSFFHKKLFFIFLILFTFGWKLWHYAIHGNIITLSFPFRIIFLGWADSISV